MQVGKKNAYSNNAAAKRKITQGRVFTLLLHLIHLAIQIRLLLQSSTFSNFLLLTLALDFLRDKVLVGLQATLHVDLELDNVVEHTLELGVQFLADGRRAKGELLVPVLPTLVKSSRMGP